MLKLDSSLQLLHKLHVSIYFILNEFCCISSFYALFQEIFSLLTIFTTPYLHELFLESGIGFGLEENQIPLSFIIHGEWNHEENLNIWKDILKEEMWLPKWNTVIGKYKGKNIGFANVYMETATTLAVAKRFDKKAIGLLNLSDHLIKGDTLYAYTKEREVIEAETDKKIRDVALYLSSISEKI